MYLDDLASRIRNQLPPGTSVPGDSDELFLSYAVLARAKGTQTTLSDVHDAWVAWQGRIDATHPALVPFDALSESVRHEDEPFLDAIRIVSREIADPRR